MKGAPVDESEIYKVLGRMFAEARNEADKSQVEIANLVGISRDSLANIENGRQRVHFHIALQLRDVLNMPSLWDALADNMKAEVSNSLKLQSASKRRLDKDQLKDVQWAIEVVGKVGKQERDN